MQRGIDFYFSKKAVQQSEPNSSIKRKALAISSDEECSPEKLAASISNKKRKCSTDSAPKLKNKLNVSRKNINPVDISCMFAGEATREGEKGPRFQEVNEAANDDFSDNKYNESKIGQPTTVKTPENIESENEKSSCIKESFLKGCQNELKFSEEAKELSKPDHFKLKKNSPSKTCNIDTLTVITKIEAINQGNSLPLDETFESKHNQRTDLEASILLDEERFERRRASAMLYQKFKNRQSVINPGSKEVPEGKPNCLAGLSFLITGVLESLEKEEAYSIIKDLGGKVSTTVGKRLNYLIAGEDAGPKKLAHAESIGTNILSVDGFFNLIREKSNETIRIELAKNFPENNMHQKKKTPSNKMAGVKQEKNEQTKINIIKLEPKEIKQEASNTTFENNIAWVEKYKPTSVKQIIGQQGSASNCAKLMNWLSKWHTNQNRPSSRKPKPSPWTKDDDGSYFKAALLSGPPGVGKTTTASLVCKELGFDVVEFNASDTRSKRLLKVEVSELLSNKSLYGYFHGNDQVVSKKHVLIMDEVDGMAGNEDRGGIQELITLIKDTHIPIICMCNDRNHQKMRALVNFSYDLRFIKPRLEQIKGFVRSICFKEKVKLSNEKIEEIILATNNDIRQSVNHLYLLSAGKQIELNSNNAKTAHKDLKMGPWEVVRKVFSVDDHKTMSLAEKSDLFFHDYSMAPLFVQQNYLMVSPKGLTSEVTKKVALTADALSIGDLVDRCIRSNAAWTLLPVQAVLSSVLPGEYMKGHFIGQINFPGWLGKYSRASKRNRLAQELHDHSRLRTSGSRLSIRLDYAPFLLSSIVRPLKENGLQGVEKSLKVLQEYRLLREDIDSLIELTTWPGKKKQMDDVDGRVKAALTRAYNKEVLPYSYSVVTGVKKKKKVSSEIDDIVEIIGNEGEAAVIDSDEEIDITLENDNLIKAKKQATPLLSSMASTSKASTAAKKTTKSTARSKK